MPTESAMGSARYHGPRRAQTCLDQPPGSGAGGAGGGGTSPPPCPGPGPASGAAPEELPPPGTPGSPELEPPEELEPLVPEEPELPEGEPDEPLGAGSVVGEGAGSVGAPGLVGPPASASDAQGDVPAAPLAGAPGSPVASPLEPDEVVPPDLGVHVHPRTSSHEPFDMRDEQLCGYPRQRSSEGVS